MILHKPLFSNIYNSSGGIDLKYTDNQSSYLILSEFKCLPVLINDILMLKTFNPDQPHQPEPIITSEAVIDGTSWCKQDTAVLENCFPAC